MRVVALAADRGGCGLWRVRIPAAAARNSGADISVKVVEDLEVVTSFLPGGLTRVDDIRTDGDVISFQRPTNRHMVEALRAANRRGIATVVEIDDDLEHVHPDHVAKPGLSRVGDSGPQWLKAACREADAVTVSTPALAELYGPKGKAILVRNYIPTEICNLQVERDPGRLRVGWAGSVGSHPADLRVALYGGVGAVFGATGAGFVAVGDDPDIVARLLGVPDTTPKTGTGWVELKEYPETLRKRVDVGLVPLEDTTFNRAKSWVAGLTYAALGIPFIASRTPEYALLAAYGHGRIAHGRGWQTELRKILNRHDLAVEAAVRAREKVKRELTVERHAMAWVRAWQIARERADARTGQKRRVP